MPASVATVERPSQIAPHFQRTRQPPTGKPLAAARVPELDGVRGTAIILVLLYHFAGDLPQNRILAHTVAFGWAGVNLFFVLSGFLITGILIRTRHRSDYFTAFYLRRSLRIFPVYYATLAFLLIAGSFIPGINAILPPGHDRIWFWLYLSNWTPLLEHLNQNALGHFWSLAVEEQFYWMWPLIVFWVNPKKLSRVACGIFLSALLLRIVFIDHHYLIRWNTFCQTDGLMAGALLAIASRNSNPGRLPAARTIFIIAIIGAGVCTGDYLFGQKFTDTLGLTALAVAFAGLLRYVVSGPPTVRKLFRSPVLTAAGKYSYGIYVYHQPIYLAMLHFAWVPRGWPTLVASLTATAVTAVLSYELLEKHILGLKDRVSHQQTARCQITV